MAARATDLSSQFGPGGTRRSPPLATVEQRRQLRRRERDPPRRVCRRPHELALLQPLGQHAKAHAIVPDQLDQPGASAAEGEHGHRRMGSSARVCCTSMARPVMPFRMSGHARRAQVDPQAGRERDHRSSRAPEYAAQCAAIDMGIHAYNHPAGHDQFDQPINTWRGGWRAKRMGRGRSRLFGHVLWRRGLCLHLREPGRRARDDRGLHAEKLPPPSVELPGADRVFADDLRRRQARTKALSDNLALLLQAPSSTLAAGDNLNTVATSTPMTTRTSALMGLGCWQDVVHRRLASRTPSAPQCAAAAPLTPVSIRRGVLFGRRYGVASHSLDPASAERLWAMSERLLAT